MVILCYFIKLLAGTLPVQGTLQIQFSPLAVFNSETFRSLLIAAFVNSVIFFIMIDYITNTRRTMKKRFTRACTYPFRHWKLLYKGLAIFFLSNLLIYIIGMMVVYAGIGSLFLLGTAMNVWSILISFAYFLLFSIFVWLFLSISQAWYILYDDPDTGIFTSIKRSFHLMKGSRWSLLGFFVLTGVGMVLGALLIFVGLIFCLVLYEVMRLTFYRELLRKRRREEWQATADSIK